MITAAPAVGANAYGAVTTTSMLADLARNIGKGFLSVHGLMGAGIDPHSYRQTRKAIISLLRSDLVIWHGLQLEVQMMELMGKLSQKKLVVAAAEAIPRDQLLPYDGHSDRFDPHVWMDPNLWSLVAAHMADVLEVAFPDHKTEVQENLAQYQAELSALHTYAQQCFQTIPEASRVLVTAHDAFKYLGKRYRIEVVGIQGISTNSEAGVFRITELVDLLVARDIKAVFVESSVSSRNLKALIEGARSRGHDVSLGGELFADAMGIEGSYTGTYLGMFDYNVTIITRALGGTAPNAGRIGRLEI